MLDELRQVVARRAGSLDVTPLRERFGDSSTLQRPSNMFEAAQLLCRIAAPRLPVAAATTSEQGADLLIRFIAEMPESLAREIREVPSFVPPAARAWLEPHLNPFVALACTVQDIWAHLLGPESQEDDAIAEALVAHFPRTAYDFGCGAGHFSHVLAAAGVDVDGFEVDPLKRAFFEYRAQAAGLYRRMRLGQHRACYDMVLAINVLDHLEDPLSVIAAIKPAVAPGKALCTLAAFPKDGWHQSEPSIIAACGQALWDDFALCENGHASVPWMDCWIRRKEPAVTASLGGHARMNPGSTFHESSEGRVLLHANRFYSSSVVLDTDTADVCRRLDGLNTVSELAQQIDVAPDDLLGLCCHLQQHGHLHWCRDGGSTRAAGAQPMCAHTLESAA